ncbi:unnamed protein product, partial [Ectocarpus sp. 12 AP-2014]
LTLLQSSAGRGRGSSRGRGRPGRPSTSNRSFFAIEGRRDLQSVEVFALRSAGRGGRATPLSTEPRLTREHLRAQRMDRMALEREATTRARAEARAKAATAT